MKMKIKSLRVREMLKMEAEFGMMWSGAKKCSQLLEGGKGREEIYPWSLEKGHNS